MKKITSLVFAILIGIAQVGISEAKSYSTRISLEGGGNSAAFAGLNLEYFPLPFLSIGVGASTILLITDIHTFIHLLLPLKNVRPFIGASVGGHYVIPFLDSGAGIGYSPAVHLGIDWQTDSGLFLIVSYGLRIFHTWADGFLYSSHLLPWPSLSLGFRL